MENNYQELIENILRKLERGISYTYFTEIGSEIETTIEEIQNIFNESEKTKETNFETWMKEQLEKQELFKNSLTPVLTDKDVDILRNNGYVVEFREDDIDYVHGNYYGRAIDINENKQIGYFLLINN